jgi:hypothetical protein
MRTKTLLLTAALCAAGIATSMAQSSPVYSVNAVGYVNTALQSGFNLISNPLNNTATDGNLIKNLFGTLPDGSQVYLFNGTGFDIALVDELSGGLTGPANVLNHALIPGEGVFVRVDAPQTVTFVGEVPAGNLSNPIPAGFSVRSSQVPQAGKVVEDLKFPVADGDQIYLYNNASGKYNIYTADSLSDTGWDAPVGAPAVPSIDVGQAMFVQTATAKAWTRSFSISQ